MVGPVQNSITLATIESLERFAGKLVDSCGIQSQILEGGCQRILDVGDVWDMVRVTEDGDIGMQGF